MCKMINTPRSQPSTSTLYRNDRFPYTVPVSFVEICFHLTLPLAERVMKSYAVTILMKRLQQYFQMVNTMNIACGSNFRVYG